MTTRTVCDGCGAATTYKEKCGSWARLYVPSDFGLFGHRQSSDEDRGPELDLCPACLRAVQSLLSAFPQEAER